MSSSFLSLILPQCDLTKNNRLDELKQLIDSRQTTEVYTREDIERRQRNELYTREDIERSVDAYTNFDDYRDVAGLIIKEAGASYYVTGWYDYCLSNSYEPFSALGDFPGMYELLLKFAKEDFKRPTCSAQQGG